MFIFKNKIILYRQCNWQPLIVNELLLVNIYLYQLDLKVLVEQIQPTTEGKIYHTFMKHYAY